VRFQGEQLFGFLQEAFLRKGFAGTRLEISLQAATARFVPDGYIRSENRRQIFFGGGDVSALVRIDPASKIVRRTNINVGVLYSRK